ncbi:AMP-binding protein [Streptomyces sp. M10(2022)]
MSVWEFFWPLISGATLVIAKPGGHRDPAYLAELIRREAVTVTHFVPSMLQAFLREPGAAGCTGLRRVICSGEALPAETQRELFSTLGSTELHNLYGPTEAAVDATHWQCRRGEEEARCRSAGRWPTCRRTCWTPGCGRCRRGGGRAVPGRDPARQGIRRAPALTAERFVACPFSAGNACIGPVTWPGGPPTASWSTSAARTRR